MHKNINILHEKQTDETKKLKYLISKLLIMKTVSKKTTCQANIVFKLYKIIKKLQKRDIFFQYIFEKVKKLKTCMQKSVSKQNWNLNKTKLLKF